MTQGAVCITGMHRSGTSMVTNLLRQCGLYLGPEEQLVPAGFDNPDGFWEHSDFVAINDQVLARYNAAMDWPPPDSARWTDQSVLGDLKARARALVSEFDGHDFWGWKDPRTSLTLPFWTSIMPEMPVVICIRNPLEVAHSLHQRNGYTKILGLNLWQIYNERLLQTTTRERRISTHYDAYFSEPERQVRRLLNFVGPAPSTPDSATRQEVVRPDLRHRTFDFQDLIDFGVSPEVLDLYLALCEEADWFDHDSVASGQTPRALVARHRAQNPDGTAVVAENVSAPDIDRTEVDTLRGQLAMREAELQDLAGRLAMTEAQHNAELLLRKALNDELVLLRELLWRLTPRIEAAGSTHAAIDTVDGRAANGPQPIEVQQGQAVRLEGWALDTEAGTLAAGVLIVLDGEQTFWAHYGSDRPDIADAFHQPAYARCGFHADLPSEALAPGRHTVALAVLAKDRPAYFRTFASTEAGAVVKVDIEVSVTDNRF